MMSACRLFYVLTSSGKSFFLKMYLFSKLKANLFMWNKDRLFQAVGSTEADKSGSWLEDSQILFKLIHQDSMTSMGSHQRQTVFARQTTAWWQFPETSPFLLSKKGFTYWKLGAKCSRDQTLSSNTQSGLCSWIQSQDCWTWQPAPVPTPASVPDSLVDPASKYPSIACPADTSSLTPSIRLAPERQWEYRGVAPRSLLLIENMRKLTWAWGLPRPRKPSELFPPNLLS